MNKSKGKRRKRKLSPLQVMAALLLMAGAAAILVPVLVVDREIRMDAEEYEQLREHTAIDSVTDNEMDNGKEVPEYVPFKAVQPIGTSETTIAPTPAAHDVGGTGVDLSACKAENADFIAWLQIPGTAVDYPVVSTDDTQYYLSHTFSGKKSYLGTLFSLLKTDYTVPSQNIAIYGHHIRSKDNVMFSPLLAYKDVSFYAGHETVYLDSLYRAGVYKVFAVVNMRNGDWEPSTASFPSDVEFLAFVDRAKALSLYDTGVEVEADDEILTLITCDRSYIPVEGRLVVMAVKQ